MQLGKPPAKWAERGGKRAAGGSAGGSSGVCPGLALALAQCQPHVASCPPRTQQWCLKDPAPGGRGGSLLAGARGASHASTACRWVRWLSHSPLFASVSLSFPIINVSPSSLKHLRRGIFLLPLLLFFLFIFSFYFTELLPAAPQTSNSPRVLLAAGCVWPPRLLPPTLRAPDCFCWLFAGETKNPPKTKQPPGVLFGPEEWGTDPGAGGPRAPRMALGPLNQMPPNTPLGFDAP